MTLIKFGERIQKLKIMQLKIFETKNKNETLIGYGAPAKATTALNFFGISNEIDFIVEDNKLKQNKIIPGVNIPIQNKINGINKPIIVLAWNFFKEIKKNNYHIKNKFINIKDLEK